MRRRRALFTHQDVKARVLGQRLRNDQQRLRERLDTQLGTANNRLLVLHQVGMGSQLKGTRARDDALVLNGVLLSTTTTEPPTPPY